MHPACIHASTPPRMQALAHMHVGYWRWIPTFKADLLRLTGHYDWALAHA